MKVLVHALSISMALCAFEPAHAQEALYAEVAGAVKAALPEEGGPNALRAILRTLRLVDEKGALTVPLLEKTNLLHPVNGPAFVDEMVRCAAQNPYLNRVMERLRGRAFHIGDGPERAAILRSATYAAVVFDRLTRIVRSDWRVLRALVAHWKKVRQGKRLHKVLNAFELAKVLTIDIAMDRFVEVLSTGKIRRAEGREGLPLNIMEAGLEDLRLGYADNARTALTLTVHPPGAAKANAKTGAAPSRFSDDRKAFLMIPPLPRQWADLYSTWNMAFVSHYPNFPFFFAKLMTPVVGCYQENPGEYLFNRAVALHAFIQFEILGRFDREAAKEKQASWANKELTKLWSAVNRDSARDYERELERKAPSLAKQMKKLAQEALRLLSSKGEKALLRLREVFRFEQVSRAGPKKAAKVVLDGAKNIVGKLKAGLKKLLHR